MSSYTEQPDSCVECEFDQNLSLLRELGVFASLPLESQRAYAYLCKRVHYQPGDAVFTQGHLDNTAYLIISGSLTMVRTSNGEETPCGSFAKGELIGALALMADVRRLFTVQAAEPAVCLVLPRKKLLTENTEVATKFMAAIAERVVTWEERLLQNNDDLPQSLGISLI